MEKIIARFVRELRRRGIPVSPGEILDGIKALAVVGVEGRESVRALLRVTLVKNVNHIPVFNEVFDSFFTARDVIPLGQKQAEFFSAMIHIVEGEELKVQAAEKKRQDEEQWLRVDEEVTEEDLKDLLALDENDDDEGGPEIMVQLDGFRGKKDSSSPSDFHMPNPPSVAFSQGVKPPVEPFSPEELNDMQEVVARMLIRIRKDVKRMKDMEHRGKLHISKTIQKNYRNGMVPFLLALRRKKKEKPRLVVLCDVSYSVSHAVRFMLLLLHTIQSRVMHVRSFVFNRDVADITALLRNLPVNLLLDTIDKGEIVNLDDNSDFGNVFVAFKRKHLENLRGKPAVIIMGDARNNYNESNEWALEEIREKAGYMLWLTPEERDTWKRGDCLIDLYGSYCDKVEVVQNVDDLSRVVEELFTTLYDHNDTRAWRHRRRREKEESYDYRQYYSRGKQ